MKGKEWCRRRDLSGKGCRTSVLAAASVLLLVFAFFAVVLTTAEAAVEVRVNASDVELGTTTFVATILVDNITDLNSAKFYLSFDASVLEVTAVEDGEIGEGDEKEKVPISWSVDAETVRVRGSLPLGEGVSGSGYLAKIEFEVKGVEGEKSELKFSEGKLVDKRGSVFLFAIDENFEKFKDELNDEEISDDLKDLFEENGYPLQNPTVKVAKEDKLWNILDFPNRAYKVKVRSGGKLRVSDTGEILASWSDAEVKIGQPTPTPPSETEEDKEDENAPEITAEPAETVVSSVEGELKTFKVTVDQAEAVEIRWQLNETEVQRNESVSEAEVATYTNASAAVGTWNLTAIATNTENGLSTTHTWFWTVTPTATTEAPGATSTPTPEAEETETDGTTATPTTTLALRQTPLSEEEEATQKAEPTATPPSTEEKKKRKTKERPAPEEELPGFEAVSAIAVIFGLGRGVAEVLQCRRKRGRRAKK